MTKPAPSEDTDPFAICRELGISEALIAKRGLRVYPEAKNLSVAEISMGGRKFLLTPQATDAWRQLKQAAMADGITIFMVSAFRSIRHQGDIIRGKLAAGADINDIVKVLAPPGFSEHHTGRALDLTTPDSPAVQVGFELTPAFAWLQANANDYGFVMSFPAGNSSGYQYEPWHWCYQDCNA